MFGVWAVNIMNDVLGDNTSNINYWDDALGANYLCTMYDGDLIRCEMLGWMKENHYISQHLQLPPSQSSFNYIRSLVTGVEAWQGEQLDVLRRFAYSVWRDPWTWPRCFVCQEWLLAGAPRVTSARCRRQCPGAHSRTDHSLLTRSWPLTPGETHQSLIWRRILLVSTWPRWQS